MNYLMKQMSILVSLAILGNIFILPSNVLATSTYIPTYQLKDYNPFDEEEDDASQKTPEQMTFKERLKAKQVEEARSKMNATKNRTSVTQNAFIPAGLKFNVELVQAVSSKGFKEGSLIKVKVCDNIIVNDVVVVEKGSDGTGYIYQARKAGGLGRKGKLKIAGNEVKTVNGIPVPLRGGLTGQGKTAGGSGVVFAVVSMVGGLFMKGSNINYPAGTMFEVEVREDVDLGCRLEDLAKVMDPKKPHGVSVKIQ